MDLLKRLGVPFVAGAVAITLAACSGAAAPTATPLGSPMSSSGASTPSSTASTPSSTAMTSPAPGLSLVAVGDSIPNNSPQDCPGCGGFVDRYAGAIEAALGTDVQVLNKSTHDNLTVDVLLDRVRDDPAFIDALATADIIVVGIAHNDAPMNRDDDACDGVASETPDWSLFTDACIAAEVKRFTPSYDAVYDTIATLRDGKPTILRTINRYNDWIGWPGHDLPPEGIEATRKVVAAWNQMICSTAEKHDFTCADVSTAINGPDGTTPAGDLLAGDYTHPSDQGNAVIADVLTQLGYAPLAR